MAGRYLKSAYHGVAVPSALGALLALAASGTAVAASGLAPCDDSVAAIHDVPPGQLQATNVAHEAVPETDAPKGLGRATPPLASANYMQSEAVAKAAPLPAYDQDAEAVTDEISPDEVSSGDDDNRPSIKARVPGVSDGDLARYKKHMLRRDI